MHPRHLACKCRPGGGGTALRPTGRAGSVGGFLRWAQQWNCECEPTGPLTCHASATEDRCWCRVARKPTSASAAPPHSCCLRQARHGTTSQTIDPCDRKLSRRLSSCRAALKRNRPDRCNRSTLTERPPTQTRILLRRAGMTPASSAPSWTGAKQSQFLVYTTVCAFTFSYC